MDNFIFLTAEGYTFQPDSDAKTPDIENLQVIGFASGVTSDEAYKNLLRTYTYLKETSFSQIFCYRLGEDYEKTKKDYNLRNGYE